MSRRNGQRGATTVEFALVAILFFAFLFGILDISRMLFTWNAANDGVRSAARYATVCHTNNGDDSQVLTRLQQYLPQITAANVSVQWTPAACNVTNCQGVTVSVTGVPFQYVSPLGALAGLAMPTLPPFTTFLTREVMGQDPYSCIAPLY